MKAKLVSLDYSVPECDMSLDHLPLVIGHASDAEIHLDDLSVSPRHCRIDSKGASLVVHDLGSTHGTFVNGMRVSEAVLEPGDELSVGMKTFLVQPG